ncbi:MAG: hypothetical protein HND39_15655 [Ignavibacteriota bacterium]|jgi:hypothetical protein|uniref:hypothetical protein n=1 Tax=Ignavibacterium album TaxID=591197 RepID=UPI00142BBA30|nr:MAG: hypothetical protein EDM72_08745 [Chlorobiota bacterium]MBE7477832.1 hypothetical protein [Ignavibacteriales bacterium]MBL1124544.1 hypothetical protein [Ignavibacteriota bacterium]MCE7858079.1 hypothetical protein [Ignavibacteria bacterium CHB3]MCZ7612738.1 hypothetical protein [Ignavibacteriaceae bacterium]
MELRKRNLGFALGLLWGLTVMLGTWWLLYWGSPGAIISKLSGFYFGYTYSFVGGIVGLIWGFVDGFITGVLIAWFYNLGFKVFKRKSSQ